MNEQLVKELISCKLKISRNIVDLLPGAAGEKVRPFYEGVIKAFNEATGEYINSNVTKRESGKNSLKMVAID